MEDKRKPLFSCYICDVSFTAKSNLKRHCNKKHETCLQPNKESDNKVKSVVGQFHCSSCNATFTTKWNLKIHCKKKHGTCLEKSAGKFHCRSCNATFTTKWNSKIHYKQKHETCLELNEVNDNKEKSAGQFHCRSCNNATFTTKWNLKIHCKKKHGTCLELNKWCDNIEKSAGQFHCSSCSATFTTKWNLKIHCKKKHKTCLECDEKFPDLEELYIHTQAKHKSVNNEDKKNVENHQCEICDKSYTTKPNLNKHMEIIHKIDCKKPPSILCPLCDGTFQTVAILDKHLVEIHNIQLKEEDTDFDSIEDFKKWKSDIEKEDIAFFFVKGTSGHKTYYACHRSGSSKMADGDKKIRCAKPAKMGRNCPARIVTTNVDGRIKVHSQRTHVGHDQSVEFLRLTKEERDELAGKLRMGMTPDQILDDIHESMASQPDIRRIHLLDKQDLLNIMRDYNLNRDVTHKNDAFNFDVWIQEQMSLGENSPVLYYKKLGCEDGGLLSKEDFMIILMTTHQRDILAKYRTEKVCVDSTHKTTDHDFQLTSIVTVNEFGDGWPVSFCVSNRVDVTAMKQFFESVKEKVGQIEAKVFMSDDAPAYINAWTDVMSKPEHHLICNWHIDNNCTNNLKKIQDPLKQSEVYKACRMLMECLDTDTFHDSLDGFLLMCAEDPDIREFGDYFKKYYATCPEKWAFCYRICLASSTNMFLGAMQNKTKYFFMEGHQNESLDKCIGLLMRFVQDMMFERTICMVTNKQIVQSVEGESVHIRDSLTPLTRLKTLLTVSLGIADNTKEEAVLKALPWQEKILEVLRENLIDQEAALSSIHHFPEPPSNLPRRKQIEIQHFDCTKKQLIPSDNILVQPTGMKKASIQTAVCVASPRCIKVIRTELDHNYGAVNSVFVDHLPFHTIPT